MAEKTLKPYIAVTVRSFGFCCESVCLSAGHSRVGNTDFCCIQCLTDPAHWDYCHTLPSCGPPDGACIRHFLFTPFLSSRWPLTHCSSKPTKCVNHKLAQNTHIKIIIIITLRPCKETCKPLQNSRLVGTNIFFRTFFLNSALSYFPALWPRDQFRSLCNLQRNLYFSSLQLSFGF